MLRGVAHETQRNARLAAFMQARTWSERCLALGAPGARPHTSAGSSAPEINPQELPCWYWQARSADAWARALGPAQALQSAATTISAMSDVERADDTIDHGGPDRTIGATLARLPMFAGQDLRAAHRHLLRSIEIAPDYLDNRVTLARTWAVASGDRDRFQAILDHVLHAKPRSPEDRLAQAQAQALLAQADQLFGPPTLSPIDLD